MTTIPPGVRANTLQPGPPPGYYEMLNTSQGNRQSDQPSGKPVPMGYPGRPIPASRHRGAPQASSAARAPAMYEGQRGTGSGLVDTSNQVLSSSNSALSSVPQVKVKQAQFVAEAEGAHVIARGAGPLLKQSQIILRRHESERETKWNVLAFNKLPMYTATYSMYCTALYSPLLYSTFLFIALIFCTVLYSYVCNLAFAILNLYVRTYCIHTVIECKTYFLSHA